NNLQTSSNTSRVNQYNSPRINRNAGYESQRSGNVAGARQTVGSSMVQKSGIQCYNCKDFGHVARECQKPKRAKDVAYHREKMLLSDMNYESEQIDKNDEDADLAKEQLKRRDSIEYASEMELECEKKAKRSNPRLYDIGCYNDNLALMLAPESDEMIRL
nr:hypothetical protein [Tanacetum cinerariifolium]